MAYDEGLAQRIREIMDETEQPYKEKQMFGGMSFMLGGNVACGVIGEELCVRVGADGNDAALALPNARPFNFTGKPMAGWIYVAPEGLGEERDLRAWVKRGVDFAKSLPPK